MESILRDLQSVVGVHGVYVCTADGRLAGAAGMEKHAPETLSAVARTLVKTFEGLRLSGRKKIAELDFVYAAGRIIVKNLGNGCLVLLCAPSVNLPLLNLSANLAARKLPGLLEAAEPAGPSAKVSAPALAPSTPGPVPAGWAGMVGRLRAIAVEFLGVDGGQIFDREFGRAGLTAYAGWESLAAWLPQFNQALSAHPDWRRARQMVDMMAVALDEIEG
jgi:predicted regulator of Ras-like GTPase activity (Roadblock/LC7/MglB family)